MLVIRYQKIGKKNQPSFRLVVIDKRKAARGGRAVEILGAVNPFTKRKTLKKERINYWLSKGAKPSPTVHNLLVSEKIIEAKKINVSKKVKKAAESVSSPAGNETDKEVPSAAPTPSVASAPIVPETAGVQEVKPAEAAPVVASEKPKPVPEEKKEEPKAQSFE